MKFEEIVILVITGGIAGWLAGIILKKGGLGIVGNIIVGVVGAFIGTSVFSMLDISIGNRHIGALVTATVGAVILLFVIGIVQKPLAKK